MVLDPRSLRRTLGGLAVLGLTLGLAAQGYNYNIGPAQRMNGLGLDDEGTIHMPLGFSFPLPGGGTTTAVDICTNGYIWLNGISAIDDSDWSPSIAEMLAQEPRIFAHWDDLRFTQSPYAGDLYLNSFPGSALITYAATEYGSPTQNVKLQIQLFANGTFTIYTYDAGRYGLVGVTQGLGAADPGETDLSAGLTGGGYTVYEFFTSATTDASDLQDLQLTFTPNGSGYDVASANYPAPAFPMATSSSRGTGCGGNNGDGGIWEYRAGGAGSPVAPYTVLYTWDPVNTRYTVSFAPTPLWDNSFATLVGATYGWRLGTADDGLSNPIPTTPLTFSAWGRTYNQIEINPNGQVFFGSGQSCQYLNLTTFPCFGSGGLICALGSDLDDSVSVAPNGIYADHRPADAFGAERFIVTWNAVSHWTPANGTCSMQVGLFANGDAYATVMTAPNATNVAGAFQGALSPLPPQTNFATALPTTVTELLPPNGVLSDAPILGTAPLVTAYYLHPNTLGTVLHVGIDKTSIGLGYIGMPGCIAYTLTLAAVLPMTQGSFRDANASLGMIPVVPSISGTLLTLQAVSFVPGANSLNLLVSDGVDLQAGGL